MKKEMKDNIWKFYIIKALRHFGLITPIFVLFYLENNLNLTEIALLATIFGISFTILEVPSGVFADLYGRKTSMILGALFYIAGYYFRAAATSFEYFSLAMVVLAVGISFISGADSALLYDTLLQLKRENEYKKIAGNVEFINWSSMGLGSLLGGFLSIYGLRFVHYMVLVPSVLMLLISLTLKEPKIKKKIIKTTYFAHLKEGLNFSVKHKKVRNLILFSGFMIGLMLVSHQFFQPYMKQIGIATQSFGVFYAIFLGLAALSSKYAYKIEEKLGERKTILIIPIALIIQFILMGKFSFFFAFIFIFFGEFAWGFTTPIMNHYVNQHIESHHRATILSIKTLMQQLIWSIAGPFIGYFADIWSIQTAFLILAGIIALIAISILATWKLRKS